MHGFDPGIHPKEIDSFHKSLHIDTLDQIKPEYCTNLQEALQSDFGDRVLRIILPGAYKVLNDSSNNKVISNQRREEILNFIQSDQETKDYIQRCLNKLEGVILNNSNVDFINSLMLDNKFSAEKIISELKKFLENYKNTLDIESDEIHPLGDNIFTYKNSQGFYHIVYKNLEGQTIHFKNHPNFTKVPLKHSNNIFSGQTETGCYIFQVVPENVFGEEGDFIRIKHHFFENAPYISELYFDKQTQESFFDVKYSFEEQENNSRDLISKIKVINTQFEQKDFLENSTYKEIYFGNGIIICSDSIFKKDGTHTFYSTQGEKIIELKGILRQELQYEIFSIEKNRKKKIIKIANGKIYELNKSPINFRGQNLNNILKKGKAFITLDGALFIYRIQEEKFQSFNIPKITNIEKNPIRENVIMDISKQKYIFINGILYKLKDEFIIKNYEIHERTWKYLAGKKLLSFENGFAEDMNYSWSQEELDTYFDVVETIDT